MYNLIAYARKVEADVYASANSRVCFACTVFSAFPQQSCVSAFFRNPKVLLFSDPSKRAWNGFTCVSGGILVIGGGNPKIRKELEEQRVTSLVFCVVISSKKCVFWLFSYPFFKILSIQKKNWGQLSPILREEYY